MLRIREGKGKLKLLKMVREDFTKKQSCILKGSKDLDKVQSRRNAMEEEWHYYHLTFTDHNSVLGDGLSTYYPGNGT